MDYFILLVIGFIFVILWKFRIIFNIIFFLGLVIYKFFNLFKTKKISEQEKYYKSLNYGIYKNNYSKQKKTYDNKIPYNQYKKS
ncbi:hypothetical protein [Candidatus Phytoplasma oryzae]|nr:hypothetical protein PIE28_01795 [Candidatus Phytoplasma oryzae]